MARTVEPDLESRLAAQHPFYGDTFKLQKLLKLWDANRAPLRWQVDELERLTGIRVVPNTIRNIRLRHEQATA